MPIRSPVVLAKEMATLDYLSNGRLLPAIGLGQEDPREYEACGVSKEDRGRRTDEAMTVMRRLWHEDSVTHEGQFYTLHDVTVNPKPVQVPFLPIWIGGRSTAAQKRVGRTGDGWLVSSATAREVQEGITVIFDTAAEFGREIEEDHMGALISYYIAPTHEEAAQVARDLHHPAQARRPLHRVQRPGHPGAGEGDHTYLPGGGGVQVRGASHVPSPAGP